MASKFKYISEEDFKAIVQTVQRLKKKQTDEQKWLNLISDSTIRSKESTGTGCEQVPSTQVVHQQQSADQPFNNSQNPKSESLKKCEGLSADSDIISNSSTIQESCVEEVSSADIVRIKNYRSRISATLDEMVRLMDYMPIPEDEKDLARRTLRATEFSAMFTRNYLYQLQRNETDLKKHQNVLMACSHPRVSQLNNIYQKLAAAYHVGLQALQVYLHHIPKTILSALPGKLKNLLAYLCHLEMALDNCNIHIDDGTSSSNIIMSKCENLLALITTKRQEDEICSCTTRQSSRGRRKEQKKMPTKSSPYIVKDSKKRTVSNKSKMPSMCKSSGYLNMKKPVMKTRVVAEPRNMEHKKSTTSCSACTAKVQHCPVKRKIEKPETSCFKSKINAPSVCHRNSHVKDLKMPKKSNTLDAVDEGAKKKNFTTKKIENIRQCQAEKISRTEGLCELEKILTPVCTCTSVNETEEEMHSSDTNYGRKMSSFKGVTKTKESGFDEILRRDKQSLLKEISSSSTTCRCTADAKEQSYFFGEGRELNYPVKLLELVAQCKDCSNLVNKQKSGISQSSKGILNDSRKIQSQTYQTKVATTDVNMNQCREKSVLQRDNVKIPWSMIEKFCDDFIKDALQDIVGEAEDTLSDIGKTIFENEFKCLFP